MLGKVLANQDDRAAVVEDSVAAAKEFDLRVDAEMDGEPVDSDDRYMGHIATKRQHIVGLFLELSRTRTGR